MKELLNRLINHEAISKDEARDVLVNISKGKYNQSQIASFLTVYMMRSITLEELEGFRDALLELCIHTDLSEFDPIDLCGTGGDGKDTFNISTLASFVTAGAGVKVSKHGNYGVSSACGSSNVMEHLGVKFTNKKSFLKKSMKNVAPIRRELGVKTFFNMLGPMVNPAFPKNQLVGVFNLELQRLYGYLYQKTDKNYTILHALDGYDEISLTGQTKAIRNSSERMLSPTDFGVDIIQQKDIYGGSTVKQAAKIFMKVINGKGTNAQNNVVCANAGMAIATAKNTSPLEGFELAKESLMSGQAKTSLQTLIQLSTK